MENYFQYIKEDYEITENISLNFDVNLYNFQKATIDCMVKKEFEQNIENRRNIGFLTNKVGSGKTLTALGYVSHTKNKTRDFNLTRVIGKDKNYIIEKFSISREKYINTTLIIIPHTLTKQWEKELKKTDLSHIILNTKKSIKNHSDVKDYSSYDVVILTSTMINEFIFNYPFHRYFTFDRIIIDEFSSIKITYRFSIQYRFLWLINAYNYSNFVFILKKYIYSSYIRSVVCNTIQDEKFLSSCAVKCSDDYIDKFMTFNINTKIINCIQEDKHLEILSKNIDDNELKQLIASHNLQEIVKRLGGNSIKKENIIELYTVKLEKQIEDEVIFIDFLNKSNNIPNKEDKTKKANEKISSLKEKLSSLKNKIEELSKNECPICRMNFEKPVMTSCCSNIFCEECIIQDISYRKNIKKERPLCPLCRVDISQKNLIFIGEKKKNKQEVKPFKITEIFKIIENSIQKKGKIIICSLYDDTFIELEKILKNNSIKYAYLKGQASSIQNKINKFNEGENPIIFLNANYIGAGINIEQTTDIIFFHRIDETLENQVIGRALRLDRDKNLSLNVYKLLYDFEI